MKVLCGKAGECSCHNISSPGSYPVVESLYFSPGRTWEKKLHASEFVFVTNGELQISFDRIVNQTMDEGKVLLLPLGCLFKARTDSGVSLVVLRPGTNIRFCRQIMIPSQNDYKKRRRKESPYLETVPPIRHFLTSLVNSLKNGFICQQYMDVKVQELFFLLHAYYAEEKLVEFFLPLFNNDSIFVKFVWDNYKGIRTVNEFACLYSCSVSNFDKKFKRVFGMPAYKWMMKRKNEVVFHEITMTEKPFCTIAKEHGFPSNSQFTDYCKKHLGKAPTKLRKEYTNNWTE